MRKGWPLVVGGLVLGLTPLMSHAGECEGVLHMSAGQAASGSATSMDWYLKGDKARVERSVPSGEGEPQPDLTELMKQLGEAMKQQPQSKGGQ